MQQASNDRRPLTLAMSDDDFSTVGGSSVATSSVAGLTAPGPSIPSKPAPRL